MICPYCGKTIPENSLFCSYCGDRQRIWEPQAVASVRQGNQERFRRGFLLFNPAGRLNRLKYFFVAVLYWFSVVICRALPSVEFRSSLLNMAVILLCLLGVALSFAVYVIAVIKRFHDMNRPGTDFFLLFIPFYNIYIGFKLLLGDSVNDSICTYEKVDSNGHYWQAPLVMLVIPLLVLGSLAVKDVSDLSLSYAIAKPTSSPSATAIPPKHFYSAEAKMSIDYPGGWTVTQVKDFVFCAMSPDNKAMICLNTKETTSDDFDTYSYDALSDSASFFDTSKVATWLGVKSSELSDLKSDIRTIGGHKFIELDFYRKINDELYRQYIYLYTVNGKEYELLLFLSESGSDSYRDDTFAAAKSLLVADDAKP